MVTFAASEAFDFEESRYFLLISGFFDFTAG